MFLCSVCTACEKPWVLSPTLQKRNDLCETWWVQLRSWIFWLSFISKFKWAPASSWYDIKQCNPRGQLPTELHSICVSTKNRWATGLGVCCQNKRIFNYVWTVFIYCWGVNLPHPLSIPDPYVKFGQVQSCVIKKSLLTNMEKALCKSPIST